MRSFTTVWFMYTYQPSSPPSTTLSSTSRTIRTRQSNLGTISIFTCKRNFCKFSRSMIGVCNALINFFFLRMFWRLAKWLVSLENHKFEDKMRQSLLLKKIIMGLFVSWYSVSLEFISNENENVSGTIMITTFVVHSLLHFVKVHFRFLIF